MKFTQCYTVLEKAKNKFAESEAKKIDKTCAALITAAENVVAAAKYLDQYGEKELEKGNEIYFYSCGIFRTELGAKLAELWTQLAVLKKASDPDISKSTFAEQSDIAKEFLYDCVLPFFAAIADSDESLLEAAAGLDKKQRSTDELTFIGKQRRNATNRSNFLTEQQKVSRIRASTEASISSVEVDSPAVAEAASASAPGFRR